RLSTLLSTCSPASIPVLWGVTSPAEGRQGVRPHGRGPQRGRCFLRNRLKGHQGLLYCAPVKIADTAFVTSSLCFQAARSGKIVKSLTVLPHFASNLVRALSSPGKAR